MRSVKGGSQTNLIRSRNNTPNIFYASFLSAVTAPWSFLSWALTESCPDIRKSQPFVSPVFPRGHRPVSYHLICCGNRDNPPSLLSGALCETYMAFYRLCVILLFNHTVNTSSSGFLTTDPLNERLQMNYFICRECRTQENAASCYFSIFPKSSPCSSWSWPSPRVCGEILGQTSNHMLEVKTQANSCFSMCDLLLAVSALINLARVEGSKYHVWSVTSTLALYIFRYYL